MGRYMYGGIIKTMQITKRSKENKILTKEDKKLIMQELKKEFKLEFYDTTEYSNCYEFIIKEEIVLNNIRDLTKEFTKLNEEFDSYFICFEKDDNKKEIRLNKLGIFGNIMPMFSEKLHKAGFSMSIDFYPFIYECDKYIDNFEMPAYLLTKMARATIKNKLSSTLLFWVT